MVPPTGRATCADLPDPSAAYDDGISMLNRYLLNYDFDGPCHKWLQLLWWEFPPEHWAQLREGYKQNCLPPPLSGITPNSATDSVDELLEWSWESSVIFKKVWPSLPMPPSFVSRKTDNQDSGVSLLICEGPD